MEKEFEIDIQDANVDEAKSVQLPMNFLTFGEIENDDVKVYIKQDVYKALEKLAASDTSKELGSIILGQHSQEMGKTHVIISDYIEAKYTDASASTLTFTHETWDYVHSEHAKCYPDKKIIGWQHTHPNYGIFLSNYDMFIQENFFNLPFQVAYVIDPVQNIRGFFQWKNGRVEKLKGYYIYDDIGKPIKIEQTKVKKEPAAPAKSSKVTTAVISLLCVALVALSALTISMSSKYEAQLEKQEQTLAEMADQQVTIEKQEVAILDQTAAIKQLQALVDGHSLTLQEQAKLIEELKAQLEQNEGLVTFKAHTVIAGDNLTKICEAYGLDYGATIKIILAVNGIEDPNQITIGQTILLPVVK